jgi:hypothetical protein
MSVIGEIHDPTALFSWEIAIGVHWIGDTTWAPEPVSTRRELSLAPAMNLSRPVRRPSLYWLTSPGSSRISDWPKINATINRSFSSKERKMSLISSASNHRRKSQENSFYIADVRTFGMEWVTSITGVRSRKPKLKAVGILCADHAIPSIL